MKNFRKTILYFILLVLVYVCIALIIRGNTEKSLRENCSYTNAVITEYYSISFVFYYKYEFTYDGKKYEGSEKRNQKSKFPAIGDTIKIEFDTHNPKNNKVISEHNINVSE
jgi:hypothetical protein